MGEHSPPPSGHYYRPPEEKRAKARFSPGLFVWFGFFAVAAAVLEQSEAWCPASPLFLFLFLFLFFSLSLFLSFSLSLSLFSLSLSLSPSLPSSSFLFPPPSTSTLSIREGEQRGASVFLHSPAPPSPRGEACSSCAMIFFGNADYFTCRPP